MEAAIEKDKVLQTFVRDRLAEGWMQIVATQLPRYGGFRSTKGLGDGADRSTRYV
jgi:hypothetical protein